MSARVEVAQGADGISRLTLCGPRSNALEPGILDELCRALDTVQASGTRRAVLAGGPNFSTGGDVALFHRAATENRAADHADAVVPLLQDCVARMVAMPVIFALAGRGAITGGAAGLLFAADMAVLAPCTFVQPYYARVGFAPDGGWTALLPERIGAGAAADWLLSDRRATARDLCRAGLAREVHETPEQRAAEILAGLDTGSALAVKRLIWDADRVHRLQSRLAAETEAFRALVARPETRARMAGFLGKPVDMADV